MEVIYRYENIDKNCGPRYYLGSKSECSVKQLEDSRQVLFYNATGKEYYGSSSNPCMRDDLKAGHRFTVEILEVVPYRELLRDREKYHLELVDAAGSTEYYNISNNALSATASGGSLDAPVNFMGETWRDYASNRSATSKRDALAEKCGHSNFVEFYLELWGQYKAGKSKADLSLELGKNKRYLTRLFSEVDLDKVHTELEECAGNFQLIEEIRYLVGRNISLQRIAKYLGIHYYVCRALVGAYYQQKSRKSQNSLRGKRNAALINDMSETEYEQNVVGLLVQGEPVEAIAELCNTSKATVARIIREYVTKTVDVTSLEHFRGKDFWEQRQERQDHYAQIH